MARRSDAAVAPFERQAAGQHFEHHGADAQMSACSIDVLAQRLLRRHVGDRADRRAEW